MKDFNYDKIVVHDGLPHADDVLCCVFAKKLNPNIEIIRTRNEELLNKYSLDNKTIVCDVGFGKYDHHQENRQTDEDGRIHCAASLFFEDFGELLFNTVEKQELFKKNILFKLMDQDNGIDFNSEFSNIIQIRNGTWLDEKDTNKTNEELNNEKFENMYNLAFKIFDSIQYTLNNFEKLVEKEYLTSYDKEYYQHNKNEYKNKISDLSNDDMFSMIYDSVQEIAFDKFWDKKSVSKIEQKYDSYFIFNCLLSKDMETDSKTFVPYDLYDNDYENNLNKIIPAQVNNYHKVHNFIQEIVDYEYELETSLEKATDIVSEKAIKAHKILTLDEGLPFRRGLRNSGILFTILPNKDGGYNLFPTKLNNTDMCIDLPNNLINYNGCTFLHPDGFMATFDNKQNAINAAQKILNNQNLESIYDYIQTYAYDVDGDNLYKDIFKVRNSLFEYIKDSKCTQNEFIENCNTINNILAEDDIKKDIIFHVASVIINEEIIDKIINNELDNNDIDSFNQTLISESKNIEYNEDLDIYINHGTKLQTLPEFENNKNELETIIDSMSNKSDHFKYVLGLVNKFILEQNPNKKEKISEHILNEITTLSYSEMQTIIDCMDNHDVKINDAFIK